MRIAILGGSFDPPHNGHRAIACEIKKQLGFDQVLLMPCYQHPFRKSLSQALDRLAMTRLLEGEHIKVSDFEVKQQTISYSIDTLNTFSAIFPNDTFSWILGSDQLIDFPKWKNWQAIIQQYGLIIVPRKMTIAETEQLAEKSLKLSLPATISFIDSTEIPPVSSTSIREKVKNNESIEALVPKTVEEYIIKQQLYK